MDELIDVRVSGLFSFGAPMQCSRAVACSAGPPPTADLVVLAGLRQIKAAPGQGLAYAVHAA